MSIFERDVALQEQIDEIIHKTMDRETKKSIVRSMRAASFSQQKKANSFQTIMSISNTMVGTSTLVFPVLYKEVGIISALVISIFIACISTKTSQLLVTHSKYEELDLPETLIRVLGPKWNFLYNASNILLLYVSGMIYMILVCNQVYSLACPVLEDLGIVCADQTNITFSKVSYQWMGVIYFAIILPLMLLRNLGFLLKLIPLGTVSVFTFIIFMMFEGIRNIAEKGKDIFSQVKLISYDIDTLAGTFTLALMVQSLIIPIVKNNANALHNKRDIALAFSWTWFVYQVVGIFGAFAITGLDARSGFKGDNVLDFINPNWMTALVQILLFFQLTFVFPVLQFVTRSQFFGLIYGVERPPNWQFYGFSVFYALSCLICQMLEADLSMIISLLGAITGMFQIYIVPILLHLVCLYRKRNKIDILRITQNIQQSQYTQTDVDQSLIENVDLSHLQESEEEINIQCNDHTEEREFMSKKPRIAIYFIITVFGIYVAIAKVVDIILGKK